ncbi:MAG TPA: TolC family protein [Candidatus Deferrimicrobium sp.]|nr:TolC family protein [Candidatus Deferrimicrobium sp.]
MRRVTRILVLVVSVLTISGMAVAKELTLDDCLELALKNRASIIAARGQETVAKWNERAALGAFLPRVSASYSYVKSKSTDIKSDELVPIGLDTLIDTFVVGLDTFLALSLRPTGFDVLEAELDDQDRTSRSLDIRASMSVANFSDWFDYAAARAERAGARLDVIRSEQDLIYAVKTAYYAYLAAVENVGVQEDAVKRSEEQLKLIQSKFDLGSAAKSDVLKQKVRSGNDRLALLTGQNMVTTTRADLAYTVGIDPGGDVTFSTAFETREFHGTLNEAVDFGLNHKPSLLAARKSVEAANHSVRSRWSEYLPKLSAFASLDWSDGTRGDTVVFNFSSRSRTVGFEVTYNIFDGFFRERNLSQSRVSLNDARAGLADMTNLVSRDIRTAYFDIEKLKEQKRVAQENVDAAQEDMKITQEKYNLGAATILDLLDAQVSLKTAQVSLVRAGFELNLSVAALERAMGKM